MAAESIGWRYDVVEDAHVAVDAFADAFDGVHRFAGLAVVVDEGGGVVEVLVVA